MPESNYGASQKVIVMGRLIEDSTCLAGQCNFTWTDSETPTLTSTASGIDFTAGQEITLSGTNFNIGTGAEIVIQGVYYPATVLSANSLKFTMPALPAGTYTLFPRIINKGFAGSITFNTTFKAISITPSSGSLGGADVTITGNGFSTSSKPLVVFSSTGS